MIESIGGAAGTMTGKVALISLVGRSRRWDWIAVGIVVAAYAIRLVTQVAR